MRNAWSVLMVCTANVCRSPMAERLAVAGLRQRLGDGAAAVRVSSAGTAGWEGEPMQPNAAAALLDRGADPTGFVARALTRDLLQDADLVLCATRGHRSAVVTLLPRAVARTFTLREFARLLGDPSAAVPAPTPAGDDEAGAGSAGRGPVAAAGEALVRRATGRRGRQPGGDLRADDITDPYLMPLSAYETCADLIAAALAGPLTQLVAAVDEAAG